MAGDFAGASVARRSMHESPEERSKSVDTIDMACHTWALSGNPIAGTVIHRAFESLSNELGMPYATGKVAMPPINDLVAVRQKHMEKIAGLAEQRTELMGNKVYICGGFGPDDVCPMHL